MFFFLRSDNREIQEVVVVFVILNEPFEKEYVIKNTKMFVYLSIILKKVKVWKINCYNVCVFHWNIVTLII